MGFELSSPPHDVPGGRKVSRPTCKQSPHCATRKSRQRKSAGMTRIDAKFAELKAQGRKAFVTYVMAGDPDFDTSLEIVRGLPAAGVDVIELGLPFTDPMADGATIQLAGQRALAGGMTLQKTLDLARSFRPGRRHHTDRPDGLLQPDLFARRGSLLRRRQSRRHRRPYCGGLAARGRRRTLHSGASTRASTSSGLPHPPRTTNACRPCCKTPPASSTTSRLPGSLAPPSAVATDVGPEVARIKSATDLPIIVGFGIKTPEGAAEIARVADGVVVGSAIVEKIANGLSPADVLAFVKSLADGAHTA